MLYLEENPELLSGDSVPVWGPSQGGGSPRGAE